MRLHRFYVTQPLGEDVVVNDVSLINQWKKVLRYVVGDFVILYNGDGYDCLCSIEVFTKDTCVLKVKERKPSILPLKRSVLFLAIVKKDNFELVVKMATELGVTDIVPLISDRTEKKPLDQRRLTLIIKEASEQSGRGDLLLLHDAVTIKDIEGTVKKLSVLPSDTYVATLHGDPIHTFFSNENGERGTASSFVIGPEGGWTEEEEEYFAHSPFKRISLGTTTLRAETAGIVCSFLSSMK
jgi:16S rRNA (uracil1498-N3)-methyltransferase